MFVSRFLQVGRKERPRDWLEENLIRDCPKLSDEDVQRYGEIYEHIRDFLKVWKSQQARLLATAEFKRQSRK
jgi:hypothetical protein